MFKDLNSSLPINTYFFLYIFPFLLIFNGYWQVTGAFILFTFVVFLVNKYKFEGLKILIPNVVLWVLLLSWGLYITFKSPETGVGFQYYIGTIFIPFLIFILINNLKLSQNFLNNFFLLLFIVGAVLGAYSLFIFIESGFDLKLRIPSLWQDFNIMSTFLMILSMFNLSTILNRPKDGKILFYILTLVFIYIGILLSQTRGVFLAILFSFIIFIVKKPKIIFPALVIALVVGLLFSNVIVDRFLSVKNFQSDASSLGRLQAWFATILLIKSNPLSGYGFDSFIHLRDSVFSFYIVQVLHSHSTYLRMMLELGIVGFTLYFSFVIRAVIYSFRVNKNSNFFIKYKIYIEGLQLSFLGLLVTFFFEPYLSLYGASTVVIWLLISFSFNLFESYKNSKLEV